MPGLITVDKYQPARRDWAMDPPEPRSTAQTRILSTIAASTASQVGSMPTGSRLSLLSTTFEKVVPHCAANYDYEYTHSYLTQVAAVVYGNLHEVENNDLDPNPTEGFYTSAVHRHLARAVMDCREVELEAWPTIIREESAACMKALEELDNDRMLRRCDRGRVKDNNAVMNNVGAHDKGQLLGSVEHATRWFFEHVDMSAISYSMGLLHGAVLVLLIAYLMAWL